ncbi:DUF6086 family protein [Streptomyces sp. NPDC002889]|uniref:DUF6086 family protein n=1 Tax=Streptomyces sp. NPDC002889 TaxID=3364669 RepID=UPI00368C9F3F
MDPIAFEAFVNAAVTQHRQTQHGIMAALTEGFVATVLALAVGAGVPVHWTPVVTAPGDRLRDVQVPTRRAGAAGADERAWAAASAESTGAGPPHGTVTDVCPSRARTSEGPL